MCAGVKSLDFANGCNSIPGADYCTQAWAYWNSAPCTEPGCKYSLPGAPCTDMIKPCSYTYYSDYHEGGCCVVDPCTPISGCPCGSLATSNQGYGSKSVSCSDGCGGSTSSTCYCYKCDLGSCPVGTSTSGSYGYKTTKSCTNDCNVTSSKDCYCDSRCTLDSCPSKYSTIPLGFGNLIYDTCTNDCGQSRTRKCYCKECTFSKTCAQGGYESTPQGNGNLIYQTCENDCGIGKELKCYCPAANCADLDPYVTWSNTKPSGDYRTYTGDVPILNNPNDCPDKQSKTCYIAHSTNNPPENTKVEIVPKDQLSASTTPLLPNNPLTKFIKKIRAQTFEDDIILGFSSTTHSGRGLDVGQGGGVNNPVGLTATYTDVNGQDDIVAIYVWWTNVSDDSNLNVPNKIANNSAHSPEDNWGFLISRDFNGNWNKIYVPSATQKTWRLLGDLNSTRYIKGPDNNMVELDNISVTNQGTNEIYLELTMRFLTDTGDTVSTEQYNLWALANDYVGFTQFETTDGDIKDSGNEFWRDSRTDWNLDMVIPNQCNIPSITDTEIGKVTVKVSAEDNDDISYVRLDACKSGVTKEEDIEDLTSNLLSVPYTLKSCDNFNSIGNEIDMTSENSLLGNNGHSPSKIYSNDVVVGLNGNAEGSITFYLTVMDDAGNFDQDFEIYRLEQWAMVKDGFVFGKGGVTSSSRLVVDPNWNGHDILEDFEEEKADLTNQILMGGKPSETGLLRALERYKVNKSFKVARYPGILMTTPYAELMSAYTQKAANNTSSFEYHSITEETLSGNLLGKCPDVASSAKDYCILESQDNLTINRGFECNGKGLIIAKGNITITPDLTSGDSVNEACIILSGGNINIQPGSSGEGSPVGYDKIHAYLIANGEIHIPPDDDGLYVEGGLAAFAPTNSTASVFNEREVSFNDMGIYPVMIVENNAKYGFLSRDVFGSQIDIFKLEIGFKPF